jgi:hypothetical protein
MVDEWMPSSEVLADLRKTYSFSDDQVQRYRSSGLLLTSQHGLFSTAERQRLIDLCELQRRIGNERTPHSELAFWLALNGRKDVPEELIAKHLCDSVEEFASQLRRGFQRCGTGRTDPERIRRDRAFHLGELAAKNVTKALDVRPEMETLLGQIVGAFLSATLVFIYIKPIRWLVERAVTKAIESISVDEEGAKKLTAILFEFLEECRTFFRRPNTAANALFDRINERVANKRGSVSEAVAQGRVMLSMIQGILPWLVDPSCPGPRISREQRIWIAKLFPPFAVVIALWSQEKPEAAAMFAAWKRGDFEQYHRDAAMWRDIVRVIGKRFRQGEDPEPAV